MKSYYDILGVDKSSSAKQIKASYRKLARKLHPDVNPGDKKAEAQFKELSEAYRVLSDDKLRKQYDAIGHQAFAQGFTGQGAGPSSGGFDFGNMNFDFGSSGQSGRRGAGFGSFRDVFNSFFAGQGAQGPRPRPPEPERGQDIQFRMEIGFMDSVRGRKAVISVQREKLCKKCGGSGKPGPPCRACGGRGTVPGVERIRVVIPAGVENGGKLRLIGKGNEGPGGAGDLYIVFNVMPHSFFTRKGPNIYCEAPITVPEAVLGGKIEVPTIDGRASMRIPPGTQSGQTLRLRGKGIRVGKSGTRGDQYVTVRIVVPKTMSEEMKRLMQEYERLNPEDVRSELASAK
ncbi:DnaJ domain-containing protein [bacterium]|nr:DnaJ domain-containing protein [bacterium]